MRKRDFEFWLENTYRTSFQKPLARSTRQVRVSNCVSVEEAEGDLDEYFRRDGLRGLLAKFSFSKEEEMAGIKPRHRLNIPKPAVLWTNTAMYKQAINLYRKFCEAA